MGKVVLVGRTVSPPACRLVILSAAKNLVLSSISRSFASLRMTEKQVFQQILVKRTIHKDKFFFVDIDADGAAPGFGIDQPGGFVFAAAGNLR